MRAKTVVIIVVLAALVGGGAVAATWLLADDEAPETQALVPENTFLYAEGSWALSGDQREACDELVSGFPGFEDCTSIGERLRESFDDAMVREDEDITYEEDIDPWLGDDFAVFMTDDNLAALFESSQQPTGIDLASQEVGSNTAVATTQEMTLVQEDDEDAPQPVAALLVSLDDEELARDFLDEEVKKSDDEDDAVVPETRSYEDVDYYFADGVAMGVASGHFVVATDAGMKAVIDQADADTSVQDNDRFTRAEDAARDERLGLAYFDLQPFVELIRQQVPTGVPPDVFDPLFEGFETPITSTAHLEEGAVVVETTSSGATGFGSETDDGGAEEAMRALPAEAWGAVGTDDLGTQLGGFLDFAATAMPGGAEALKAQFRQQTGLDLQTDVLDWMGATALFIGGDTAEGLYGGATIETSDPTTTVKAILQIERLTAREGQPTKIINRAGFRGFVAPVPGQKQVGIAVADDERAVFALAPVSLLDRLAKGDKLGDTPLFEAAEQTLGDDFHMGGVFDVDIIRTLIEDSAPVDDVYAEDVRPFLEPLEHVVFGSMSDGDVVRDRFVIGVE